MEKRILNAAEAENARQELILHLEAAVSLADDTGYPIARYLAELALAEVSSENVGWST